MKRRCSFCEFEADYDAFPDGSVACNGYLACADCLENPRVERVMELVAFSEFLRKEIVCQEQEILSQVFS